MLKYLFLTIFMYNIGEKDALNLGGGQAYYNYSGYHWEHSSDMCGCIHMSPMCYET